MKRILKNLLVFVFLLFSGIMIASGTTHKAETPIKAETTSATLYLKMTGFEHDGARFATYVWNNEGTLMDWYSMNLVVDETDIYQVVIPNNGYHKIIFNRMNGATTDNNWENRWNQSYDLDLTFPPENNMYVFEEYGDEPMINGRWSNYIPPIVIDPDLPVDPDIEPSIYTIHYWRNDGRHALYNLWLWGEGESGKGHEFSKSDDYGRVYEIDSRYFKNPKYLNLIIRIGDWDEQTPDIKVDVLDYPLVVDGEGVARRHFYLIDMETIVYKTSNEAKGEKILTSSFVESKKVSVMTYHEPASYKYKVDGLTVHENTTNHRKSGYYYVFDFTVTDILNAQKAYILEVTFKSGEIRSRDITLDGLFDSKFFIDNLTYTGDDLGANYTPAATTFKVWAPTSRDVKINIYENGTPLSVDKEKGSDTVYREVSLTLGEKGVWTGSQSGDLHAKYYTIVATNINGTTELVDPYAKSAGINGARGMIVDFSKTNPVGWDSVTLSEKEATDIIPYELHVSDLTSDDTWNGSEKHRKKFLGLVQQGTKYQVNGQAVVTGFDHILELGVNAVQILPFYDQENDETEQTFNWGYNPKNYNVLEGSYSSDPYNGLNRIAEFKQVVQAYAEHDIRIIMDVVYNHVASLSNHSFTKLVPGYYFRYSEGQPSNASGVGNDTASERIMFERFMVDSTAFWAEEYKLGGFRFDLMGLHTVDSMNAVMNRLKEVRSDILVYGEPWDMDGTVMSVRKDLAKHANLWKTTGIGGFNDQLRDGTKGGSWANSARTGWVQSAGQDVNKIVDGVMGKVTGGTTDPSQVVNYISVHDNYTIYDHLRTSRRQNNLSYDDERIKAQALQSEAVSLLGQGIGFIHAGSEMLRSKPVEGGASGFYDHNSYKSSYEVNSMKWDEKWANMAHFNAYRQMVALKKNAPAFNHSTRSAVDANSTAKLLQDNTVIRLTYTDGTDTYTIYHHGASSRNYTATDLGGLEVLLDSSGTLERGAKLGNSVRISSNTSLVVRNVRNRGADDPTFPPLINYTSYSDPIDIIEPIDPTDSTEPPISLPDTTDLPDTSEIPPASSEEGSGGGVDQQTLIIVGASTGGVVVAGGLGFGIFKLIKRRRL